MSDKRKRKRRVNKLSDLSIDEVSLVDRGANQHASVVLSKRDEDGEEEEDIEKSDPDPSTLHVEGDEEEEDEEVTETKKGFFTRLIEKVLDEESTTPGTDTGNIADMDDVTKAGFPGMQLPYQQQQMGQPAPGPQNAMPPGAQAFPSGQPGMQQPMQQQGMGQQMPQQQPGQMQAGPPLPDEVIQYIQQLEEALAQAQGSGNQPSGHQEDKNVDPFRKNMDGLSDDEVTFLQELSKNLEDEDTREAVAKAMEIVEKANERATEAEEIAKFERDYRLNQEFIAKARSLVNLPVSADEFGPILKKLDDVLEEEEYSTLFKALSAANETVANAGVFGEIGKQGGGLNYETVSKADAKAKELVEKSEGLSHEAALAKVFEEDPSLYDEYLQEQGH